MAVLTASKYVIPNGSPSGGVQTMQSASYGDSDLLNEAIELRLEIDIDNDLTSGNANVVDATGYDASRKVIYVDIIGNIVTAAENVTITMPPISSTDKTIIFKDRDGNGLSAPDYTLKIIPDGSDTIDTSENSLTNEFELTFDYQSQGFKSNNGNSKWGAFNYIPNMFTFNGADVNVDNNYNLVAQKVISGSSGETPIANADDANDFQNTGGNLTQTSNYFSNDNVDTDLLSGFSGAWNSVTDTSSPNGTIVMWRLHTDWTDTDADNIVDGSDSTFGTAGGYGDEVAVFDLGETKDIDGITMRMFGYSSLPTVEGCTDWNGSTGTWSTIYASAARAPGGGIVDTELGVTTGSYRYIKLTNGPTYSGSGVTNIAKMTIYSTDIATTSNTTDAKMIVSSPVEFDPSTIVIKDEIGSEVGGSSVKCIEVVGGVAGNSGTLVDYSVFKTRSSLASSSNVQVRVQPVGTQKFSSVQMSSVATNTEVNANGITQKVSGVDSFKTNSSGSLFTQGVSNKVRLVNDVDDDIELTDGLVKVDATTTSRTVTLPTAASSYDSDTSTGLVVSVAKIDASGNAVTVDGNGAETISGSANVSLASQWDTTIVQSDGTNWIKIK